MKFALFIILSVLHCQNNAYKIVTLPKADEEQHSMKVFFSTKMVDVTHKVTTTVTQTAYETCYAAEPGISECKNGRDSEESEPKVELNGVATSYESIIPTPSQTARVSLKHKSFLRCFGGVHRSWDFLGALLRHSWVILRSFWCHSGIILGSL